MNLTLLKLLLLKFRKKNQRGNIFNSHKISKTKTIISETGSMIVPSLVTRLNFLATIPSIESEIPIKAIMSTRFNVENSEKEC